MCIYSAFLLVSLHIMVELNIKNRSPETELFLVIFFITSISIELLVLYFIIKTGESYEQQQKNELIHFHNSGILLCLPYFHLLQVVVML